VLLGSKSRGYADLLSDDDVEVFVSDEAYVQQPPHLCVEQIYDQDQRLQSDIRYTTLALALAKIISPSDADHWPYEHAQILSGSNRVRQVVESLGQMDEDFRRKRVCYAATSLTIALGKTGKALQRGYEISAMLSLVRATKACSRVLFALERRWCPPDHWLEKEILTLKDAAQTGPLLLQAIKERCPEPLREALLRLEKTFPDEIPGRGQRASLYSTIMHPAAWQDRSIHMLL
jgi:hypothetical protein